MYVYMYTYHDPPTAWARFVRAGGARQPTGQRSAVEPPSEKEACIYIYIYIYIHTHTHVHIYIYIYIYICIRLNNSVYTYMYIHIHIHTYTIMPPTISSNKQLHFKRTPNVTPLAIYVVLTDQGTFWNYSWWKLCSNPLMHTNNYST